MGGNYHLRWSAKTKNGRILEEFLTDKENASRFKNKIVVECSKAGKAIEDEVHECIGSLAAKKEQNIVFSFQQLNSENDNEVWVEYVQGNVQGGQPFVMEWNLNRYVKLDDRVLLLRFIRRAYNKEYDSFLKDVNKNRIEWIEKISLVKLSDLSIVE